MIILIVHNNKNYNQMPEFVDINIGSAANDRTGDKPRTVGTKINNAWSKLRAFWLNFTEGSPWRFLGISDSADKLQTARNINDVAFDGTANITISKLYKENGTGSTVYVDNNGALNINGDIIQNGEPYKTHFEQVYTEKDTIIMRDGAIAGLPEGVLSGIVAKLYNGANDGWFAIDKDGFFQFGDFGSLVRAAAITSTPTNAYFAKYNSTTKVFDTVVISLADLPSGINADKVDGFDITATAGYLAVISGTNIANSIVREDAEFLGINVTNVVSQLGSALTVVGKSGNTNLARFFNADYAANVGSGIRIFTGAATGDTYTAIQAYDAGATSANDLILQSISGGGVGIGTTSLLTGSKVDIVGGHLTLSSVITDLTSKSSRIGMRHYNNAQVGFYYIIANATDTGNQLFLGGNYGSGNAATEISFFTAANNTTPIGTRAGQINSSGNWGVGQTAGTEKLEVTGNVKVTGTVKGTTGIFTNLTDNKVTFHENDTNGLKDSPITVSGNSIEVTDKIKSKGVTIVKDTLISLSTEVDFFRTGNLSKTLTGNDVWSFVNITPDAGILVDLTITTLYTITCTQSGVTFVGDVVAGVIQGLNANKSYAIGFLPLTTTRILVCVKEYA